MSETSPEIQEVMLLTSQMLDGAVSPTELVRLEMLIAQNHEARRWYFRLVRLHATLQWRTGVMESGVRLEEDRDELPDPSDTMILPAIRESGITFPFAQDADQLDGQASREIEPFSEAASARKKPVRLSMPLSIRSIRRAAIAASIILLGSIGIAVMNRSGVFRAAPPQTVARLTSSEEVQWQQGFSPESGAAGIAAGQQLSLIGGSIEIIFDSGAAVVVQAPSRFTADSSGSMTLASGRIAAIVPARAKGFTVVAAGTSVKDLGTEFGIRCGESTPTEIAVFKGTVEATAPSDRPIQLVTGDAATLSSGLLNTVSGAADTTRFPHHFQTPNPLPTLADADFGRPLSKGAAEYSASTATWTIHGVGEDTWLSSDQFNFASTQLEADATIVCRVATATTEADGSRRDASKCGIMFRATSDPGSPFVNVVRAQGRGIQMIVRDAAYTPAVVSSPDTIHMDAPLWLKLSRIGDEFTGYYSTDGVTWISLGTHVTHLPSAAYAGLVVTSGDDNHIGTAAFTNVVVSSVVEK